MEINRIESFKQFAKYLEYPVVIFEAETGKVLDINYEAEILLGGRIETICIQPGKTFDSVDFWESLHRKKSLMWHRINLTADEKEFLVCGLINETMEDGKMIYMLMFELRSGISFGSMTLERIVDHAGMVAIHVEINGEQGRVQYVTKNISQYGYTRAQFYENVMSPFDIICPEDAERIHASITSATAKHVEEQVLEWRMLTEEKELIPIRALYHHIYNETGEWAGMDILWFDLREELQRISENTYLSNAVSKMKSVVVVKAYQAGKRVLKYISPNAGIMGMNVEALQNGDKLTEDYIHPEDRDSVIDTIYQAVANGTADYIQTYRMVRDDGKKIWVENEVTITRISDGEAEISFLLTEVTEQKNMEKELAMAEEEKTVVSEPAKTEKPLDCITIDRNDTKMVNQFQLMAEIISRKADYYCGVLDTEGRLLTSPVGPANYLGQFYDMFERPHVRKQMKDVTERIKEELTPGSISFLVDNMNTYGILAPLIVDSTVVGYWMLVSFEKNGAEVIGSVMEQQWHLANSIMKSYYADEAVQNETKLRKLAEMQLHKEQQERHVIQDMMDSMLREDKGGLGEICQKASLHLAVTDIGVYIENKETENVEKYFIWNCADDENSFFTRMELSISEYQTLKKYLKDTWTLAIDRKVTDPFLLQIIKKTNMESILFLKMTSTSGVQGYAVFADSVKPHKFEEREIYFATCITRMFESIILSNGRAGKTEVIKEGAFEVYDHIRDAVFVKDNRSGDIIFANKAMDKLFGYSLVGMQARDVVYDQLEQYRNMQGVRKRFIANKKVTKWQSYMKELDQIMNITEVDLETMTGKEYSLFVLKKNKNK